MEKNKLDITFTGHKIIIPENMPINVAGRLLMQQHTAEQAISIEERQIQGYFYKDVKVAIFTVLQKVLGDQYYGVPGTDQDGNPFHKTEEIKVGYDKHGVPIYKKGVEGMFDIVQWNCVLTIKQIDNFTVAISAEIKNKYRKYFEELCDRIEEELRENSYFKGNAIVITNNDVTPMHLKKSEGIFLNEDTEQTIELIKQKIIDSKTKRQTYLFKGSYGTGKTESAFKLGSAAVDAGLTFIYVHDVNIDTFKISMKLAKQYKNCLLFIEDFLDTNVAGKSDKRPSQNEYLNIMDGIEYKNIPIKSIFTTNHPERIASAARRPGRVDVIVNFPPLNKETVVKIFKYNFEKNLPKELNNLDLDTTVDKIFDSISEIPGALVKAISENIIDWTKQNNQLTESIVQIAINQAKEHYDFINAPVEDTSVDILLLLSDMLKNVKFTVEK